MPRLKITEIIPPIHALNAENTNMDAFVVTYDTQKLRETLRNVDGYAYKPSVYGGYDHFHHLKYDEVMKMIEQAEQTGI